MPIYRYRSDNYSDGKKWNAVSNIYRFNAAATTKWQKIKKIYRYNASASTKWQLIFLSTDAPQPTSPTSSLFVHSSTYGTVGSTTEFYSGDVVRLSRGAWTASPTSYQMSIQASTEAGSGYSSVATVTYNSSSSPTAANTTNSTYIPYTITSSDALYPSYYIKGRVDATNSDGTTPLETPAILLRVGFGLSGFTISSITGTGATFSWNITGTPDASSYIYSQVLTIRRVSDNVVVKTVNITPGTSTVSVYDSINIATQTQYYAKLVVTANDSWRTSASPTTNTDDFNLFTTVGAAPVNTVSPSIIPRNNRTPPFGYAGYLPVSTSLTASQGTWNNVSGTTTYRYDWYKEDYITGALQSNINVGSGFSFATADVDDYVFVQVKATNTDGQTGTGTSGSYILGQRVVVGTISPTSVTPNQSTNFTFAISHYPTSYTINWGDGTSNETYTVSDNTSTVNASHAHTYTSAGNYTMIVTAQPGGFGNTASITVANPLTPPTSVSIASVSRATDSSVNVSLNFSGGTGPYYQMYWTTASTAPATSSYDAASTGSPILETFSPSAGYQYYFYVRSSTDNLGNTTSNGNSAAGTYSAYSSLSPNPSYTFTNPTGGTASISGNTSVGSTLTLSTVSPTASPAATGTTIVWRRADGGTGGNSFTGGTILQNGGTTYVIDSPVVAYSSVGYAIRAEVTFNNGVGAQTANSNSIVVTAALTKLATPTNVNASDNRTDGVNVTWTAVSGAAYYGVWYGGAPSYDSTPDFGGPNNPTLITGTSYLDTAIGAGVTRDYYVQAFRTNNPTGTKSEWGGPNSGTRLAAVSPPTNATVPTLTGSTSVGSTVTFGVGTWNNSPTSYDLRLYRGTQFVSSGETLVKSAGNVTSSTYTITAADFSSGQLYLRAFASASNSGGSSGLVAGQEIGPITSGGGGSAPATPTGVGLTGSGVVSWTASSGATSYEIEFYTAQSGSGASAAGPYSVTGISGSPYQLVSPYASPNNWARVRVRARNANGASAYSAWVPSETTYT